MKWITCSMGDAEGDRSSKAAKGRPGRGESGAGRKAKLPEALSILTPEASEYAREAQMPKNKRKNIEIQSSSLLLLLS